MSSIGYKIVRVRTVYFLSLLSDSVPRTLLYEIGKTSYAPKGSLGLFVYKTKRHAQKVLQHLNRECRDRPFTVLEGVCNDINQQSRTSYWFGDFGSKRFWFPEYVCQSFKPLREI